MSQPADVSIRRSGQHPTLSSARLDLGVPLVPLHCLLRTRDQLVLAGLVGYAAVMATWLAFGASQSAAMSSIRLLSVHALTLVAGVLAGIISRNRSLDHGARRFWAAICASQLVAVLVAIGAHVSSGPFGLLVSSLPLLVHGLMLYGLLRLPSAPRSTLDRVKLTLDGATVAVGGVLVLWFDFYAASAMPPRVASVPFIMAHVEALAELVLILVASVLWRRTSLRHRAHVLVLFAVALLTHFLAHVGTVVELTRGVPVHDWPSIVTPVSASLLAVAAFVKLRTMSRRELRPGAATSQRTEGESLIPYAAVLPGFFLLLKAAQEQGTEPLTGLAIGSVVLAVLAFARQAASTRETIRVLTESSARKSEARFSALVQHSSDVITILDPDGMIRYASPSMALVLGHDPARLANTSLVGLLHPEDAPAALQFLGELAQQTHERVPPPGVSTLKREWRLAHANGSWMTMDNVGTNLLSEPVINGLVLNTRDVTEQSVIKAQYMHQAFHDPLTDLANRSLFLYQVGHALARVARQSQTVTVLFLDLDNFKTVNDSLGHAAGDRLLVDAARRLAACVRDSDLIARLGGDEFAVLVEDADQARDVLLIAERIAAALGKPFMLGGKEVMVSASVGIARTSPGDSADELVRNADVAMYVAKTRGKGQCVFFESKMHTAALERLVVESDLRQAIEREEFFLQYQPIVLLETGEIIGAEALVRWCCRERGTVPPGVFIPIAEETGLISAIGRWVLRRACRTAKQWEKERGHPMRITVNLSGRQLQEPGIVDEVREALEDSGLDAKHLVLELTESMLMRNTELSMDRLTGLKALGVSLAIDDFGTGYSSLSYLQRYPIDILKIDKSFVDVIDKGGEGPVLARAIVALGETLRMRTVAEGIETEAQRGHLMGLGCELGQGYLFAPPLDAEDFWKILVARGARSPETKRRLREQDAQAA